MEITILQCLYCPDEYQLFRALNSIKSLNLISKNNQNIRIYIYIEGYFQNETLYKKYLEIISNLDIWKNVISFKSIENLGKSNVINRSISSILTKYILYIDSDIIFPEDFQLINLFQIYKDYKVFKNTVINKKLGLIALNQKNDNRHNNIALKNSILSGLTKISYPDKYEGIAGGCFFINKKILQKYPYPNVGLYGIDDTLYHKKLYENNYFIGISYNLSIHHPYDDESFKNLNIKDLTEYNQWKKTICSNQMNNINQLSFL